VPLILRQSSPAAGPLQALLDQQARLRLSQMPGLQVLLDSGANATAPSPPPSPYDLGLTLLAMGELATGMDALREAAASGPNSRAAWRKIGEIQKRAGDTAGAEAAFQASENAAAGPAAPNRQPPNPATLDRAEREARALLEGRSPAAAEPLLRDRLRQTPDDAAMLRVLGDTIMRANRYTEAERLFERALELAPAYAGALHGLALSLFKQGKATRAIPHVEQLLARQPNDLSYRILLASCLALAGRADRAIPLYEAALREAPRHVDLWQSYAQALKTAGRREESARALRKCVELAPDDGQAYWSIINQSAAPPSDADITAMRAQLASTALPTPKRFHFHYALAHALEKRGDYATSFQHYADGARLYRSMHPYRADEITKQVRRKTKLFSPAFFGARAGWGNPDPSPIFILGMPRAGSTLIEQILASHSAVEGTQELPELFLIASTLEETARGAGATYPECLERYAASDFAEFGRRYIESAAPYRQTARPFFIDKMPTNWLEIGLIAAILPNAKIIDARRDPMANGFAAFSMYFSHGMEFSYDLRDIGRYYNDYLTLMQHVDTVLPGRVHRVVYENMVTDTETEIRRLLAYCGLDFEPACLRFWETRRVVTTASAGQVRRPIFREGLTHWRNYEPWLGPLAETLASRQQTGHGA
jgi:tetratricopeptide (TPR) repeat protein